MADVDVSKIKLPGDNNDYILKDAKKTGIYTVIGTQTSSTSSWTGNISVPALYDGLTIMYYLPYASTSSDVTLNLTLSTGIPTGGISCYYDGTTRLKTHYDKGCNIVMTYWSAGSISIDGTTTIYNRWIVNANTTAVGKYSVLNEECVGTWTNSKLLYRIVKKVSTTATSWTVLTTIEEIQEDHIAFADFYCKAPASSGYTFSQSYYTGSHDMFRAALQWDNTAKKYKLYAQLGTSYPAKPAEITAIIYYTKT